MPYEMKYSINLYNLMRSSRISIDNRSYNIDIDKDLAMEII